MNKALNVFRLAAKMAFKPDFYKSVCDISDNPYSLTIRHNGAKATEKPVYHIYPESENTNGFFALLRVVLTCLHFSDKLGFIPFVQYPSDSLYTEDEAVNGTHNAFEYYFRQVSDLTQEDVAQAENVLMYDFKQLKSCPYGYREEFTFIDEYAEIYKKYIHLQPEIEEKISGEVSVLLGGKKTVGVHIRGTDYLKNFKNHPIAVSENDYIDILNKLVDNEQFEQIFVAADDLRILEKIKSAFPGKVVSFEDTFRSEDGEAIHFGKNERKNHRFLLGYEVLRDMLCLSRCDGLIAGFSNVSLFAFIAKKASGKEYIFSKILDKGINTSGKRCK